VTLRGDAIARPGLASLIRPMTAPIDSPRTADTLQPEFPDQQADLQATTPGRSERARARRTITPPSLGRVAWVAASVLVVLLFIGVAERIAWRGRVMPGVKIATLDTSGQRELTAYASITRFARRLESKPITAVTPGPGKTDHRLTADPGTIHLKIDTRTTLRHAREAGRSGNPINQVLGTFLRRIRPDRIEPVVTFDEGDIDKVLDHWSVQVDRGLREGALRFDGTKVVEVAPHGGTGINRNEAKAAIVAELHEGERTPLHLSYGPIAARTTTAQVAAVARRARVILSHGLEVTASSDHFTATPAQIASALTTHVDGGQILLAIDPARLELALRSQIAPVGAAAIDARFSVTSDNHVVVVPSQDGLQPDLAMVGRAIIANRTSVTVPLVHRHPAHDTAWANKLGITNQISTFTTHYIPGQARVTNIHRAADILTNTIVEPGKVFSLNDTLGPRTQARGFVKAPVYYEGETEDFGGGVSQIATTTYNAVFWGGFEIVEHKPHSIYYSRYPLGRDATVNYPVLDLKWRNNSHHGVLIRAAYSSSSVTVTFYGNSEGKVVKEESTNCSSTSPTERCIDIVKTIPFPTTVVPCPPKDPKLDPNNSCATLAPAETLDLSEGHIGYDVTYFRVIDQPGHAEIRERHSWNYDMTPDIILVGATPPGATTTLPGHTGTTGAPPPTSTTTIP
jgi:vancomycin resistance protein YoaR